MPTGNGIPDDVRAQIEEALARFNQLLTCRGTACVAHFKGSFVYLDRGPPGREQPMCRLKYTGSGGKWGFAIYKYRAPTTRTNGCSRGRSTWTARSKAP